MSTGNQAMTTKELLEVAMMSVVPHLPNTMLYHPASPDCRLATGTDVWDVGEDTGREMEWKAVASLIGVNFTTDVVWREQEANLGLCLQTCLYSENCLSFAYNDVDQTCQGYNSASLSKESNTFVMNLGVKHFIPKGCEIFDYILNKSLGVCFRIFTQRKGKHDADDICKLAGGNLIILDTQEKYDYVSAATAEINGRTNFWIGLSDVKQENNWIWENGEPAVNTFWGFLKGQPNNFDGYYTDSRKRNADCAVMISGHGWADDNCDKKLGFICEIQI